MAKIVFPELQPLPELRGRLHPSDVDATIRSLSYGIDDSRQIRELMQFAGAVSEALEHGEDVKRVAGENMVRHEDLEEFADSLLRLIPYERFTIGHRPRLFREVRDWCSGNLKGDFHDIEYAASIHFFIEDPSDVVLFKLRWSQDLSQ